MDKNVLNAYESLVPADQLVVDAMIIALYQKDLQIYDMTKEVEKLLEKGLRGSGR